VDLINGEAVDLTDEGVEEHCFANPFPAGGFLREYWGSRREHIALFNTLQMCACRFPRGAGKEGTAGHQKGQCDCSGAAVLSDNAATHASAVLNRQIWPRREVVPGASQTHRTRAESNKTENSCAKYYGNRTAKLISLYFLSDSVLSECCFLSEYRILR
jgi:hypothetical protein